MPRPKSRRLIDSPPLFDSFKPTGVRGRDVVDLRMSLDEFEALRLSDYERLSQDEAAAEMDISRSTFSRLIESARRKSSEFLIEGKRLIIDGGPIHFKGNLFECRSCRSVFPARFGAVRVECPQCGSTDLIDRAGEYGHGDCCQNFSVHH
jgi:predicted DNA-binding protein (UPF0251 family)